MKKPIKKPTITALMKFEPTIWIAIISLAISLALVAYIVTQNMNSRTFGEVEFRNEIEMNQKIFKIGFCYDKDIKPCDDIALLEYNSRTLDEGEQYNFPDYSF